jgi:hypothetical protein
VIAMLIGVEELSQGLVPSRALDPYDFIMSLAGIGVFAVVAWAITAALERRRPARPPLTSPASPGKTGRPA